MFLLVFHCVCIENVNSVLPLIEAEIAAVVSLKVVYAHCADSTGSQIPIPPVHTGRDRRAFSCLDIYYIYILPPITVSIKLSNTIECSSGVQKQLHSLGGHSVSSYRSTAVTLLELYILLGACDLAALVCFRHDVPNSALAAVCIYIPVCFHKLPHNLPGSVDHIASIIN